MARWKTRHKSKWTRPEDLHPNMAEGLTQGKWAEEESDEQYMAQPKTPSGAERAAQTSKPAEKGGAFLGVLEDSTDAVWLDEPTGRLQRDVTIIMNEGNWQKYISGMRCLRCHEPQDEPFPPDERAFHLPGCSYPIRDRQAMDCAMEFQGKKHIGPRQPISEHLANLELRREQREFQERQLGGGKKLTVKKKILSPGVARSRGIREETEKKVVLPPGVKT